MPLFLSSSEPWTTCEAPFPKDGTWAEEFIFDGLWWSDGFLLLDSVANDEFFFGVVCQFLISTMESWLKLMIWAKKCRALFFQSQC